MADFISKSKRRKIMSSIRSKDTKPELLVRRELHKKGFRFRLHRKDLPGTPDLYLPRYKAVILVNGCFWHSHENCIYSHIPETRTKYWAEKLKKNKMRDVANLEALKELHFRVAVLWECKVMGDSAHTITTLIRWTKSERHFISIG